MIKLRPKTKISLSCDMTLLDIPVSLSLPIKLEEKKREEREEIKIVKKVKNSKFDLDKNSLF